MYVYVEFVALSGEQETLTQKMFHVPRIGERFVIQKCGEDVTEGKVDLVTWAIDLFEEHPTATVFYEPGT